VGLFHLLDATKRTTCGASCLFRGHSAPLVLFGEQIDVRADLIVEIAIETSSRDDRQRSRQPDRHHPSPHLPIHPTSPTSPSCPTYPTCPIYPSSSIRFMIATVCCQMSASTASCFLPFRVIA